MFDWVCMNINNLIKGEIVKTKFILNGKEIEGYLQFHKGDVFTNCEIYTSSKKLNPRPKN